MRQIATAFASLWSTQAAISMAAVRGTFERNLSVDGAVDLEVSTGSGDITVRSGSSGEVRVEGQIRVSTRRRSSSEAESLLQELVENPPVEQMGNRIIVGDLDGHDYRGVSISYLVVVPRECELRSRTGSGGQTIGDLRGPVDAKSGSGSIEIGDVEGEVNAAAGSGEIRIDRAGGGLEARTGSGSIRAEAVAGSVDARTGSGGIEVAQTGPGDVDIETGSGSVRATGVRGALRIHTSSGGIHAEGEMTGSWRLRSTSGRITVSLPDSAGFDLDARTTSGSIDSDRSVTMVGNISPRRLRGQVGGGGNELTLSTTSGSIRIR